MPNFTNGSNKPIESKEVMYAELVERLTGYYELESMPDAHVVEIHATLFLSKREIAALLVEANREIVYFPHVYPVGVLKRLAMRVLLSSAYIASDEVNEDCVTKEEIRQIESMIDSGLYEDAQLRLTELMHRIPNSIQLVGLQSCLRVYDMLRRQNNDSSDEPSATFGEDS